MAAANRNPTSILQHLDEIPFSIPGETWRLGPKPELIKASPDRVTPPCVYFTRCGGCQLQQMTETRQASEKQRWLVDLLKGVASEEKILPLLPSPKNWNYRRRIQLHVGPKGEVGFYAVKSRQVIDIESCAIADPALNAKLPEVRRLAAEVLAAPKRPASLSYELTLRDDGQVEIARDGEGRSFIQVNPEANRVLIEVLRRALDEIRPKSVLELFAGNGNLSYSLVTPERPWLAVESNPLAVEAGRATPAPEGSGVDWREGEAAKVAAQLYQSGKSFDVVLLDPPRGGAEDCLPMFRQWRPPAILYVSCHVPVLRKDLQVLQKSGYEVEWLQPIDFFPQTLNLETLIYLRLNPMAHPVKK
ncbi:MAG: hypothetical protein K8R69_12190 [Deltaproteobacteria bacterium]|nr:hypothetical protein [Deltaproteobacteria bacterium]